MRQSFLVYIEQKNYDLDFYSFWDQRIGVGL